MLRNRDLQATWEYHGATKHSYASVRSDRHSLDWDNRPLSFKIYRSLEPIPLPRDALRTHSGVPALQAIAASEILEPGDRIPDVGALAGILYFSAGITRHIAYPGGGKPFRAAACTGALYHIELYLICGDLPGLPAGVYHFGVHDFALRRLRTGDFRAVVARACGGEPSVAAAPVIIACTSTFWRNAWKYQARAYRHCFWDSGTILANLLAVAAAYHLPHKVVLGFVDDVIIDLLGLDADREVTLALIPLGETSGTPAASPERGPLRLETVPLSSREVEYTAIRAMHRASSLTTPEEVRAWRMSRPHPSRPEPAGRLFSLQPVGDSEIPHDPVEQVILRRGSARRFRRDGVMLQQLTTMLDRATRGIPSDVLRPPERLNDLYLITNAVEGLAGGAYVFYPERGALELLKAGEFRAGAGYLALEQALAADANADVFFLTDLQVVLDRLGNRGYRAAQLEAGIMGGKLYLAAYALRLGATGLTFYDDEVTAFFSPHAAGKSVMFLTALGKREKRTRQ